MQTLTQRLLLPVLLAVVALPAIATAVQGAECGPGGCAPQTRQPAAVVRVIAEHAGSRLYGSGTVVDVQGEEAVVVTCGHLFRKQASSVTVRFGDGVVVAGELAGVDQTWDLAAVVIRAEAGRTFAIEAVAIAAAGPKPGEPLQSCGYGSDGRYWCNQGSALGYARTALTSTHETLQLSGMARDGDSGGPVFNARGELVAVLWGTDGRIVGGTYCGRVRQFLGGLFPRLRDRFAGRTQPERRQPGPGGVEVIGGQAEPSVPAAPAPGPLVPVKPVAPEAPVGVETPCCPAGTCSGLDAIGKRIDALEAGLAPMRGEIVAIGGRIDRWSKQIAAAEAAADQLVDAVERDRAEGHQELWAVGLSRGLAALGWTGPPAVAAILGLGLVLRRRKKKREAEATESAPAGKEQGPAASGASFCGAVPRNTTEAAQILRLAQAEGRDPLLDALVGRLTLDRLDNLVDAGGHDADWASSFRRELLDRVNQIAPVAL